MSEEQDSRAIDDPSQSSAGMYAQAAGDPPPAVEGDPPPVDEDPDAVGYGQPEGDPPPNAPDSNVTGEGDPPPN
jgi:hypothetical protein